MTTIPDLEKYRGIRFGYDVTQFPFKPRFFFYFATARIHAYYTVIQDELKLRLVFTKCYHKNVTLTID